MNKIKIAVVGSILYENKRKIREMIFKLKTEFGDELIIISGGRKNGADVYVKKFTLEFGLDYKEYNPAYTVHNLYSSEPFKMYGKKYHVGYNHMRNKSMIDAVDYVIVFKTDDQLDKDMDNVISYTNKKFKKIIIIN